MAETELLIVIVCYNSADLTVDCLHSLAPQIRDVPRARVEICENGTGPESLREINDAIAQNHWNDWVRVLPVTPNRGFAGGNNFILREAMRQARPPKYFLLLNADTIVRPGALRLLYDAIERSPDVGIIGPRLEWPNATPQGSAFLDFTPLHEFIKAAGTGPVTQLFKRRHGAMPLGNEPHDAEWISFACAIIRREVLSECGLLDEGYYLYYDDADYCRLARQAGWRVLHYPPAHVVHLRGRSNPVKSLAAEHKQRPRYWYVSRSRYYAKFYGRRRLWLANLMWHGGRTISFVREMFGKKTRTVCDSEWRDIWTNARSPLSRDEHNGREA